MTMNMQILTLPGDGIGPEVVREAVRVLQSVEALFGHRFVFAERPIGGAAIRQSGDPLPAGTLDACLTSDAILLGAVGSPEYDGLSADRRPETGLLRLRRELGAFANLRPAASFDAILDCSPLRPAVVAGTDLLIVRELLGGLYFGQPRGFEPPGLESAQATSACNTMRYSVDEVERIAHVAFQQAQVRRRHVTSVDKANVLETSRLWRQTVSRLALQYPDVTTEHMYVDACAMHLGTNPRRFDVILTENLFGDILSDEAAIITGSLGMLASACLGGRVDLYEPVHGSAPDIAGRGQANPFGAIASVALLLRHTAGLEMEARCVEESMRRVLAAGYHTPDLRQGRDEGAASTAEIGGRVASVLVEVAASVAEEADETAVTGEIEATDAAAVTKEIEATGAALVTEENEATDETACAGPTVAGALR